MLGLIESLFAEAMAIAPEYLMLVGLPELPKLQRPKFIIIRQPETPKGKFRRNKGA